MIQKQKFTFKKLSSFLAYKLSADKDNTTYRTGSLTADIQEGEPDIMWQSVVFVRDVGLIWTMGAPFAYSLTSEQIDAISSLFAEGSTGATLANIVTRVTSLEQKFNGFFKTVLLEEAAYEALSADDMVEGVFYCELEEAEGGDTHATYSNGYASADATYSNGYALVTGTYSNGYVNI